jgi:hypothetical protein
VRAAVDGSPYAYEILRRHTDRGEKSKPVGLRIGVTAPADYDFSLKPEQWRDWLSKRIGFSVEHQTGDAAFDAAVYILSNDARIHSTLSQNAVLRADILREFRNVAPRSAVLKEVRCAGGRLWVHYRLKDGLNAAKVPVLAGKVVPALDRLAADLAHAAVAGAPKLYDRFVLRAALILAVSTGLVLNGAAHMARLVLVPIPFTPDGSTLVLWSLYGGAAVLALLVLAVVWWGRMWCCSRCCWSGAWARRSRSSWSCAISTWSGTSRRPPSTRSRRSTNASRGAGARSATTSRFAAGPARTRPPRSVSRRGFFIAPTGAERWRWSRSRDS